MKIEKAPTNRTVQTLAKTYRDIRNGAEPWAALNEFFHEWFDYSRDQRPMLVADPILPDELTRQLAAAPTSEHDDLWRWAVFCAAAAEYLCDCYDAPRPAWVNDPVFTLREPWYDFGDMEGMTPQLRAHLEQTTPEPLRRRNIMGGDRVFANKYEFAEMARRLNALQ